ncbi:hypothetical protein BDV95DRAFT_380719 [Massariosphaeria phaeospora]|uniref:Zn(2)-C6 fungal-type domain-containing protein n=1 Tax=Massariosphaeria phaeospora TaxID=100035 RepID=A0A7C8M8Z6_9PLEO|nr:hypothetical protein BDV95DRAFT_380719 [Massariosphaeria phaeospora]
MSSEPRRVVPSSRRRDKPILSCLACRQRKLKCDRQQPCKACVDRGLSLSCTYARHAPSRAAHGPKAPHNVHERIDQLEKLVTNLMGAGNTATPARSNSSADPPPSEVLVEGFTDPQVPDTPDRVKLENDATTYSDSSHWTSILDGIAELREHLDEIPITDIPSVNETGPDLLFGRQRHATKQEILASMPERAEADQLVVQYFASTVISPIMLHRPTFLCEYEQFWEHPFETPVMWIGLLFSLFAIATRFRSVLDNLDNNSASFVDYSDTSLVSVRMDFYREKVVQCLILANYTRCPQYTVDTMLQYFITEYLRSRDSQFGTWMIAGMLVRIAFRMGYHRDPSHFSNISVFRSEMRRRLWAMILQLDLMSAAQVGLPRMIQPAMHDVAEPRNLIDEDLDESMVELPPSRPETESTATLYTLVRNRVLYAFARVVDLTNATSQPAYRDIMNLDATMRQVYENLPPAMKPLRAKEFKSVDSEMIMRRLFLGLNMLKAVLMLHRPYLLLGRTDIRYEYSRLACIDTALEILDFQRQLDDESRPGGRLWTTEWRIWALSWRMSSLVNHDFLLATTVLSLELDRDIAEPMPISEEAIATRTRLGENLPTRAEIVEVLTRVHSIWEQASEKSREAEMVAAAVRLVLGKVGVHVGTPPSASDQTPFARDEFAAPPQFYATDNIAEPSAAVSSFFMNNPHCMPSFPMFDGGMEIGGAFDWNGLETDFPMSTFEQNPDNPQDP